MGWEDRNVNIEISGKKYWDFFFFFLSISTILLDTTARISFSSAQQYLANDLNSLDKSSSLIAFQYLPYLYTSTFMLHRYETTCTIVLEKKKSFTNEWLKEVQAIIVGRLIKHLAEVQYFNATWNWVPAAFNYGRTVHFNIWGKGDRLIKLATRYNKETRVERCKMEKTLTYNLLLNYYISEQQKQIIEKKLKLTVHKKSTTTQQMNK